MSIFDTPQDWYFSFGYSHEYGDVKNRIKLQGRYVKIHGTFHDARVVMFKHFGAAWSMQYSEAEIQRVLKRYNWTELPLPELPPSAKDLTA